MNEKQFNELSDHDRFNRVLEGEIFYASVHTPNMSSAKKYNSPPFFGVSLGLDKENEDLANSYGLRVKEPNDFIPKPHVVIKRNVKEGKTEDEVRPIVVDAMQNPIPKSVLIGNGSEGRVKFGTYWYEAGGGGVGATFFKLQVEKLIEYVREEAGVDDALSMSEGGFSIKDHLSIADTTPKEETPTATDEEEAPATSDDASSDLFDD